MPNLPPRPILFGCLKNFLIEKIVHFDWTISINYSLVMIYHSWTWPLTHSLNLTLYVYNFLIPIGRNVESPEKETDPETIQLWYETRCFGYTNVVQTNNSKVGESDEVFGTLITDRWSFAWGVTRYTRPARGFRLPFRPGHFRVNKTVPNPAVSITPCPNPSPSTIDAGKRLCWITVLADRL